MDWVRRYQGCLSVVVDVVVDEGVLLGLMGELSSFLGELALESVEDLRLGLEDLLEGWVSRSDCKAFILSCRIISCLNKRCMLKDIEDLDFV